MRSNLLALSAVLLMLAPLEAQTLKAAVVHCACGPSPV